jgi:hypothetical protein
MAGFLVRSKGPPATVGWANFQMETLAIYDRKYVQGCLTKKRKVNEKLKQSQQFLSFFLWANSDKAL